MKKITSNDILRRAAEVKTAKEKDYQGSRFSEEDYFPFGHKSHQHALITKLNRIQAVSENSKVNFESLDDSIIDLINYAGMYGAWLANRKG